jgi:hypothetical protein
MSRTLLLSAALLGLPWGPTAFSQDENAPPKKEVPHSRSRFFDRPIDFWRQGLILDVGLSESARDGQPRAPGSLSPAAPSDWGQRVKQADGSFAVQELPRPLVQVLEDPSPENVRAYLEWKLDRTRKVLRAAEALKKFRDPGSLPGESALPPARGSEASRGSDAENPPTSGPKEAGSRPPFTLLYFHRRGCVHCEEEDRVLQDWLAHKPDGTLLTVEFGEKPELWRQFRIRGTPSLVLQSASTRRSIFLEGLVQAAELDRALTESARPDPAPADSKNGGSK